MALTHDQQGEQYSGEYITHHAVLHCLANELAMPDSALPQRMFFDFIIKGEATERPYESFAPNAPFSVVNVSLLGRIGLLWSVIISSMYCP